MQGDMQGTRSRLHVRLNPPEAQTKANSVDWYRRNHWYGALRADWSRLAQRWLCESLHGIHNLVRATPSFDTVETLAAVES